MPRRPKTPSQLNDLARALELLKEASRSLAQAAEPSLALRTRTLLQDAAISVKDARYVTENN